MARLVVAALLMLLGCVAADDKIFSCPFGSAASFPKPTCFAKACTDKIATQINNELNAAFKYMYMGAHFAQFTVDRPGIAKFMFEAATEERSHAIIMLKYLNTRGVVPNFTPYTIDIKATVTAEGFDSLTYKSALEKALAMEVTVTKDIYDVVTDCVSDYHGADVFTNPILDEQHESIRKLQGALLAFKDLSSGHSEDGGVHLAEYIFDQRMLSGEF